MLSPVWFSREDPIHLRLNDEGLKTGFGFLEFIGMGIDAERTVRVLRQVAPESHQELLHRSEPITSAVTPNTFIATVRQ